MKPCQSAHSALKCSIVSILSRMHRDRILTWYVVTASPRSHLKSLPLSKLKKYLDAYSIKTDGAVEKDDVIDRIIAARVCVHQTGEFTMFKMRM